MFLNSRRSVHGFLCLIWPFCKWKSIFLLIWRTLSPNQVRKKYSSHWRRKMKLLRKLILWSVYFPLRSLLYECYPLLCPLYREAFFEQSRWINALTLACSSCLLIPPLLSSSSVRHRRHTVRESHRTREGTSKLQWENQNTYKLQ